MSVSHLPTAENTSVTFTFGVAAALTEPERVSTLAENERVSTIAIASTNLRMWLSF
jgi:hypothetical protein